MKTNEKFALLNEAVINAGMNEKEIALWFQLRQEALLQFPIAYKKGDTFEILPYLDLSRKDYVWGYEILPGIVMAKKCGIVCDIKDTTWDTSKAYAEKCRLDGKTGKLPSLKVLKQEWSTLLLDKIQKMDMYLCNQGIDAEPYSTEKSRGMVWCFELYKHHLAHSFYLDTGNVTWFSRFKADKIDRLVVAFE